MKKAIILIIILMLCTLFPISAQASFFAPDVPEEYPVTAQAAYFTPDVEEGERIFVYDFANRTSSAFSGNNGANSWGVDYGEQVRVDELMENGWCKIYYSSPEKGIDRGG